MAECAPDNSVPNSDKEKTTTETRDPTQDNTSVVNEDVEVREKPRTSLSTSDKLEKAAALKEKGNEHFKAGEYKGAIKMYHHALLHVKGLEENAASQVVSGIKSQTLTDSERENQILVQLTCYNNLSVCMLKQEKWERVVMYATQALEMKPDSRSKALYRRGTAHLAMGNLDGADADLKKAHSMAPDDPAIGQQLRLLAEKMKAFREREKKMYSGMFDRKSKDTNKKD